MQEDLFSGWGVRTLSTKERRFNPVGYHLGSVWPHDNAIIAAGLKCCGFDEPFMRIFDGIFAAARHFEHHRLPEVFSGYARKDFPIPLPYPEACHPHVWASGAIPMILQAGLGFEPRGFDKALRIVRPVLPPGVARLEIRGLKIAGASIDLHFERTADSCVQVHTLNIEGQGSVQIEV